MEIFEVIHNPTLEEVEVRGIRYRTRGHDTMRYDNSRKGWLNVEYYGYGGLPMSETIKVTLANGAVLEGSPTVVNMMLEKLGVAEDGIHYRSETKGLIPIASMDTRHIRNAILKIYGQWVENLRAVDDKTFIAELRKGAGAGNITLLALVKELTGRTK